VTQALRADGYDLGACSVNACRIWPASCWAVPPSL